jgi:hypothetical protein
MRAPSDPQPADSPVRLAELLVSAAATLATPPGVPGGAGLAPAGMPVRQGRLHLGRVRRWLPPDGEVVVLAGFGTACWLGSPDVAPPDLGRHVHRSLAVIDTRNRVVLGRRARAWLAVADPAAFEAVTLPLGWDGEGLLVVPVEDYARRLEVVTP